MDRSKNSRFWITGAALLGCLLIVLTMFFLRSDQKQLTDLGQGRSYLSDLESKDPSQVSRQVSRSRNQQLALQLAKDENAIFQAMDDALIFGDSRASGFSYFGFLPENKVPAGIGDTISRLSDFPALVQAAKPAWMYFAYGLNDLEIALDGSADNEQAVREFTKRYASGIQELQNASPDSQAAVCSILEVTPDAIKKQPLYAHIPEWNEAIQTMCDENGWVYVDGQGLPASMEQDPYQDDGIHFWTDFYPAWAACMLNASRPELFEAADESWTDGSDEQANA